VQNVFASSDGKRFLSSDMAEDLRVLANMHVSTLARMLNILQLSCSCFSEWCELVQVCLIHSG